MPQVLSALQHHSPGTPKGREGCLGTSIRIPAGFVGSFRAGKEGSSALDHLQPDPVVLPLPGGDTWLQTYPRDTLSISGSADSLGVMLQPFSEGFPSAQGPGQDHIFFHHPLRHEEIPCQSPQAQPVFNVGKPHRRLNPAPSPSTAWAVPPPATTAGRALSDAPTLHIWTHSRGPSLAFPWSRDGLVLQGAG